MEEMTKAERRALKRKLRKERREQERHDLRAQKRRSIFKSVSVVVVIVILLIVGGFAYSSFTGAAVDAPGAFDEFAQCAGERGLVMYGSFRCGACQRQKLELGNSFRFITYVECDGNAPDGSGQPELCQQMGIESLPTWMFEEQQFVGYQSIDRLAQITGCAL
jgi:hypothetical protein